MPFVYNWNSFGKPPVIYIFSIIFFLLLIFFGIKEFQNADVSIKKYFIPALLFKLACGVGVGILYSYYYESGDTFGFFNDGEQIAVLANTDFSQFLQFLWNGNPDFEIWKHLNFIQPRALFFSKLTAIGYLLSFGNYWVVAMLFSFLSFFSAWKLVERISAFFPTTKVAAVLAFLFFPSVVFWSSGLMKESIAMAGLFTVVYVFVQYWVHKKISLVDGVVLVIGFWLLWNLKYYYAGILLISFGGMVITRFTLGYLPVMSGFKIALLFITILVIPVLVVTQLHPNFYFSRLLEVVIKNYEAYREISRPENLIGYYQLEATPLSFIINAPWALLSGLFRPFIWEAHSVFHFISGVETSILLILFIVGIRKWSRVGDKTDSLWCIGIISYIVLLAVFLALSTPNIGTLVRYRVGYFPFFVFLLLLANPWLAQRNRLLS